MSDLITQLMKAHSKEAATQRENTHEGYSKDLEDYCVEVLRLELMNRLGKGSKLHIRQALEKSLKKYVNGLIEHRVDSSQ